MFKLRRKQSPFVTVRVEEFQLGDRLVYDNTAVEILDINQEPNEVSVLFGTTHPGTSPRTWRASLYPEMLATVARY